ncbi:MAG: pilin [Patescibacteria group bacterium]
MDASPRVFLAALLLTGAFFFASPVHAQTGDIQANANQTAQVAGLAGGTDLVTIIGRIINIALGFIGIVLLVLMLYAGFTWMTAAGDPEKVKKAKDIIRNALIGLVIISSAWAITSFVLGFFAGETGLGGLGGKAPPASQFKLSSGAACLGQGIIESHLPERNAVEVPRNSPIILTFKAAIKPESMMKDWTQAASSTKTEFALNDANILLYRTSAGESSALSSDKVTVRYTKDLKTFVLRPTEYLGSATSKTDYTVSLKGGKSGLLKLDGSPALVCTPTGKYTWPFEVSTVIDLVPPVVTAVIPPGGGIYARNIVVQINFSKYMDPTSVQGSTADGFSNLTVTAGPEGQPGVPVAGEFRISNQYRTVEFLSNAKCGTNSCGRDVFCLPSSSAISVEVKAATLDTPGQPQGKFSDNGYDGAVSAVGNSLDGNKNETAEGPPTDDYAWDFGTNNDIKLAPPVVTETKPDYDPQSGKNSNVPLDQPVMASFDSFLQSSSLTSDNVKLDAHGTTEDKEQNNASFWWSVGMLLLNKDGTLYNANKVPFEPPARAGVVIGHRPYLPSGTFPNLNYYDPYLTAGVQDAYQNCFNPARKCAGKGAETKSPGNCCNNALSTAECKTILHP